MDLVIHVDGGARGNPGPAGAGVVIREQDRGLIFEAGYFLGTQTNNAAEYQALIRALQRAQLCEPKMVTVHSDSELLVRQITGQYQVKSPKLAELFERVQLLLLKVPRWMVRHIPRAENSRADALANMAMDARRDVVVFDVAAPGAVAAPLPAVPTDEDDEPTTTEAMPASAPPVGTGAIRVVVAVEPDAHACPAHAHLPRTFTVGATLPAGLCVHAAHALLPTLLALLNIAPDELASVPTMTVRCSRMECGAVFQLTPARGLNGVRRKPG